METPISKSYTCGTRYLSTGAGWVVGIVVFVVTALLATTIISLAFLIYHPLVGLAYLVGLGPNAFTVAFWGISFLKSTMLKARSLLTRSMPAARCRGVGLAVGAVIGISHALSS